MKRCYSIDTDCSDSLRCCRSKRRLLGNRSFSEVSSILEFDIEMFRRIAGMEKCTLSEFHCRVHDRYTHPNACSYRRRCNWYRSTVTTEWY